MREREPIERLNERERARETERERGERESIETAGGAFSRSSQRACKVFDPLQAEDQDPEKTLPDSLGPSQRPSPLEGVPH